MRTAEKETVLVVYQKNKGDAKATAPTARPSASRMHYPDDVRGRPSGVGHPASGHLAFSYPPPVPSSATQQRLFFYP